MREISLTQEKVALVDDEDFEELNQVNWYANKIGKTYYAGRNISFINGKHITTLMHLNILEKLNGLQIDHIDGNGLNNQRGNLRLVTTRQNGQNRKNQIKTSQYPGVHWAKKSNKWRAMIRINGAKKHLGCFILEATAFDAYRKAVNAIGEKVIDFRK